MRIPLLPKNLKPLHVMIGAGVVIVAVILYKKRMSLGLAAQSGECDSECIQGQCKDSGSGDWIPCFEGDLSNASPSDLPQPIQRIGR